MKIACHRSKESKVTKAFSDKVKDWDRKGSFLLTYAEQHN